ncbi:hypothetical protein [Pseudooceanicola nanhaiensis]|uniref:hypothetical protein n=1 Tax=Pseudooceanicola nanhaiensis TaxID=375761 RepID=UPI001CD4366E|nr:hypothetical protein [Pseudooceanicola nanhaiensis]MCA0919898.1 hypothetical protein [Pseudooceanicola nanhaiensis]
METRKTKAHTRAAIGLAIALTCAASARADGEFFQLDIAEDATDASLSIARGQLSFDAGYTRYEGGSSGHVSLLWSIPVEGLGTVKLGPSVAHSFSDTASDETQLGAKVALERWAPTSFGHIFVLGNYSTNDNDYFGLVQTGFGNSGFATEFSVGGSDKYSSVVAAVSKRLGDGPYVLRAGYKFKAETFFVGFAVNTF